MRVEGRWKRHRCRGDGGGDVDAENKVSIEPEPEVLAS